MEQTLREFMQVAPRDEVIHVGCNQGGGFFFVGTPAEYFCAENDVAAYLQLKNQRALDKARSDVRNALDLLKRPELGYAALTAVPEFGPPADSAKVAEQVEIAAKYAGYLSRQHDDIAKQKKLEDAQGK